MTYISRELDKANWEIFDAQGQIFGNRTYDEPYEYAYTSSCAEGNPIPGDPDAVGDLWREYHRSADSYKDMFMYLKGIDTGDMKGE